MIPNLPAQSENPSHADQRNEAAGPDHLGGDAAAGRGVDGLADPLEDGQHVGGLRGDGSTRRPPTASCSSRGTGTAGAVAWTAIASKGARSASPALPSPTTTSTLVIPSSVEQPAGRCGEASDPLDADHLGGQQSQDRR